MTNKMKRGLKPDVEAREKGKHQTLLQEFLDLQKEFVSRKKKLQLAKEKKETLLAEVRFLRARHGYLLKTQPDEAEIEHEPIQAQNVNKQRKTLVKEKNNTKRFAKNRNSDGAVKQSSHFDSLPAMGNEMEDGVNLLVQQERPGEEKKLKNSSINGKKVAKKKISWQDPVALQVQNSRVQSMGTQKIAPTMAM